MCVGGCGSLCALCVYSINIYGLPTLSDTVLGAKNSGQMIHTKIPAFKELAVYTFV